MGDILGFPHGHAGNSNTHPCDVEPPCEGNGQSEEWPLEEVVQMLPAPEKKPDPVNHPPHYKRGGVETIDIIEHVISDYSPVDAFHVSQVLKYLARAPHKGAFAQDIEKAHWYLSRLVRRVRQT